MKKLILVLLGLSSALHLVAADGNWLTVLDNPLAKARAQNKLILLDFTGSDWCPWCQKFKADIFDTPQFNQYAKTNLILVELDFPHDVEQSDALKKANAAWSQRFKPNGYPTVALINPDCVELGRFKGYLEGGPTECTKWLDEWKANAPAPKPLVAAQPAGETPQWYTSLSMAQAKARAEHKLVLLDFNGSDWCGWCIKLKKEVFSQPQFLDYARRNLVLVDVDFPHTKPQSPEQKAANDQLAQQYGITGYPTVIVLDADGRKIGVDGYEEGGPQAYINLLEAMKKAGQ